MKTYADWEEEYLADSRRRYPGLWEGLEKILENKTIKLFSIREMDIKNSVCIGFGIANTTIFFLFFRHIITIGPHWQIIK